MHGLSRAHSRAKIHVLVITRPPGYRSNRAAFDLVHEHAIGQIRKSSYTMVIRVKGKFGVQPEFLAWLTDPNSMAAALC